MKTGYVYIVSNKNRTTLYVGVTSKLKIRILQHKAGVGSVFTSRYNLHDLLHFETIPRIGKAIKREKQLKNWHTDWKWNLIKKTNPELKDLAADWYTPEEIAEYRQTHKDGFKG